MLNIIKKIILRDLVWFPLVKNTFLYSFWHRFNGKLANMLYGSPSSQMFVIGVTGTDGKTTTCNLIHHIIQSNLGDCVMISTANIKFGTQTTFNDTKMTSLNIFDLQKLLSQAKSQDINYAVVETSSHGWSQSRFEGVSFSLGALTNITAEHLDYHQDINDYANTKKKLFLNVIKNNLPNKLGVLPKDDEFGRKRLSEIIFDKQLDYGINLSSTLKAENIVEHLDHTEFDIKYLGQSHHVVLKLAAKFNVYNALAATATALLMGISLDKIIIALQTFEPVDGRVNLFEHKGVHYIVDFAHTPAALQSLLEYANTTKGTGRTITVFGAPGLRDTYKRPEMGKIVGRLSDIVIVTEDDSQTEDTATIINDIVAGVGRNEGDNFFVQPIREHALKLAIDLAQPGDLVLCAGKGHERYLLTNYGKITWNDTDKLKEYLEIT
ncbi:MAG: UDP-N-acetylmuramoyl-L-alanyl-D-glutamate--2,6-diaminopimelate ligase [Candidatus Absconditabacterales bacterium]